MRHVRRVLNLAVLAAFSSVISCSSDASPTGVEQQNLGGVSVTLTQPTLAIGESVQAAASVRDASGATMAGASISWNSSNPGVASVNSSGMVKALAAGQSEISASALGFTGKAMVTVASPGV